MEDIDSSGKQVTMYSEMSEVDQRFTYEIAVNAMKAQDKGVYIHLLILTKFPFSFSPLDGFKPLASS